MQEWFNKYANGYNSLEQKEKDAMYHFTLLWTLFEAQILDTTGNAGEICKAIVKLSKKVDIDVSQTSEIKEYFINRYVTEGNCNELFDKLDFRNKDKIQLVREVLTGRKENKIDVLMALLIIVFRLRNNFFHGKKWAYDISQQIDNFDHANKLLVYILELDKKSNPD
jgi:hypothetical protein